MPENLYANTDFIEAGYVAGEDQYALELLAAAPELVEFGSGGSSSSTSTSLTSNPVIIQVTTGSGGGGGNNPYCPAADQYVLARGADGGITAKLAGILQPHVDFLFNPLTRNFNRVTAAETSYQETARVTGCSPFGGETIVSLSHPLIIGKDGSKKKVRDFRFGEKSYICNDAGEFVRLCEIRAEKAGIRPVVKISLETEHIYASSKFPSAISHAIIYFLGHNAKPFETERQDT